MAKKLTPTESTWYKPVLHDIFEAGGIVKYSSRSAGRNYVSYYSSTKRAAEAICEEIKYRNFDFMTVDRYLDGLARTVYFSPLHDTTDNKRLNAKQLANILAAFCASVEIFWDDVNTHKTVDELETYKKSVFGKACSDFQCFLSQQAALKDKASKKTAARTVVEPGSGKSAPKSGYKSSGPRSGDVKGLVMPSKYVPTTASRKVYYAECVFEPAKTKLQTMFIDPIRHPAEVNYVRFGDPSGYTSCTLFFETIEALEKALAVVRTGAVKVPSNITGFNIMEAKIDSNGYFIIKTEVGEALIKANKLNEEIEVPTDVPETSETRKSRFPEIEDIDIYAEAFHKYE